MPSEEVKTAGYISLIENPWSFSRGGIDSWLSGESENLFCSTFCLSWSIPRVLLGLRDPIDSKWLLWRFCMGRCHHQFNLLPAVNTACPLALGINMATILRAAPGGTVFLRLNLRLSCIYNYWAPSRNQARGWVWNRMFLACVVLKTRDKWKNIPRKCCVNELGTGLGLEAGLM